MADGGVATESIEVANSADASNRGADAPNPYVDASVIQQAEQVAAAADAALKEPRLPVRKESLESVRAERINQMKAEHGVNLSRDEESLLRLFMNEATVDAKGGIQGMPDIVTLQRIWSRYHDLENKVKFDDEGFQNSKLVILPLGNPTDAVIGLHHMLSYPTVLKSFDRVGLQITQIELNYLTGKKMTSEERKQLDRLQALGRVRITTANPEGFMYKKFIDAVGADKIIPLDNYDALLWDHEHGSDVARPDAGSLIPTRAIQEAQSSNPDWRILVLAPPILRNKISGLNGYEIPMPQVSRENSVVPQAIAA